MNVSLKYTIITLSVIILFSSIPLFNRAREEVRRISCASNFKSIGLSLKQYAMDFGGYFPDKNGAEGFRLLYNNDYLTDYKIYQCPSTTTKIPPGYDGPLKEEYVDYVYRGGLSDGVSEDHTVDSALMWDKPCNHNNYGNILFLDGHVTGYAGADWMKHIK